MNDKTPWAQGKDLEIEYPYKRDDEPHIVMKWRISPAILDAPAIEPKIVNPPMHNDVFLNYLEWKMNRPWYKRIGLL